MSEARPAVPMVPSTEDGGNYLMQEGNGLVPSNEGYQHEFNPSAFPASPFVVSSVNHRFGDSADNVRGMIYLFIFACRCRIFADNLYVTDLQHEWERSNSPGGFNPPNLHNPSSFTREPSPYAYDEVITHILLVSFICLTCF